MSDRVEVRLAGSGGQGMILAGLILAEAAVIHDGKVACQTQSYGPEARGGASKSEVVIDTVPIDYPKVIEADVLLAMSQEACDKYHRDLKRDGLLIVDSVHVKRVPRADATRVPITEIAEQVTGHSITANMVALGIMAGMSDVVTRDALKAAVTARAPHGTKEINLKALQAGYDLADNVRESR